MTLSLTAVENLADACVAAAAGWPPGAYNIADAAPYRRDRAIREVLRAHGRRVRIGHLPRPLAVAAAHAVAATARHRPDARPGLTRYAVDQLAHTVVLDTTRAREQGWAPRWALGDYVRRVTPVCWRG